MKNRIYDISLNFFHSLISVRPELVEGCDIHGSTVNI